MGHNYATKKASTRLSRFRLHGSRSYADRTSGVFLQPLLWHVLSVPLTP